MSEVGDQSPKTGLVHRHPAQMLHRNTHREHQTMKESSPLSPPAPSSWDKSLEGKLLQGVLPEPLPDESHMCLKRSSYQALHNHIKLHGLKFACFLSMLNRFVLLFQLFIIHLSIERHL